MGRKLKTTNPFKDIDNSFTKTVTFIGEEQAKRMGRKYCLLESDSVVINDYPCKGRKTALYRIKALKNFELNFVIYRKSSAGRRTVLDGELGGYVESEDNLSQEGAAWIFDDARVYGDARVWGNALVYDRAKVFDHALVRENAHVYGNTQVYQKAEVFGNARVYDYARIRGRSKVYDQANVYGNAQIHEDRIFEAEDFDRIMEEEAEDGVTYCWPEVFGKAQVYENAEIFGRTLVSGESQVHGNSVLEEVEICGSAKTYGNAHVYGSKISDFAKAEGNVQICRSKISDVVTVEGNAEIYDSEASGQCHVFGTATVENVKLFDGASIFDNAFVKNSVVSGGDIYGNAHVQDSKVGPKAFIFDEACVSDSWVLESSRVFGNAFVQYCVLTQASQVFGGAYVKVYGGADKPILLSAGALVAGKAFIRNRDDVFQISNVGEEFGTLTAYKTTFDTIEITKGYFLGSTEDLKKIINTSYPPESKIKRTYEAILKMISVRFEPTDETDRDQKGEDYYGSRCWERMEAEIVEEKEKLQQRDPQENNSVYRNIWSQTDYWYNAKGSLVSDIENFDIKTGEDIEDIYLDKKRKKTLAERLEEDYGIR